ncbi:MAG: M48 family metalloprotease [Acidimicrobiales bacterium]
MVGAIAVVTVVVALVALVLLGLVAALVVAVVGAAVVAYAWLAGGPLALRVTGASPADETTHARLHNLTEGLCVATGLPKPALYVVDDPGANAFAVGRDPAHAAVVVTTGLLDVLGRIELEGLLAQELTHIRSGDTVVGTLVVALPFLGGLLDAHREQLADLAAVEVTRYPPGLAAALEKLRDHGTALRTSSFAVAHLWVAPPDGSPPPAGVPALDERIAALHEL